MSVSIYIPCYNAEKSIKRCLKAALRQKYPVKQVVVIDDGSEDKTYKIASQYPVRIIRHKKNKGLAASRNTAIKHINSEFIAALDADCLPDPDWLEQLMKMFTSLKVAGVGGRLEDFYRKTSVDLWRANHMKQSWAERVESPPFLFGSNTVFRKEALIDVGLYREAFKTNYEDVDICKRLSNRGWKIVYTKEATAYHLKQDNICSLLNTYWRWNLPYYKKINWYSDLKTFKAKIKDNIGLANRYIEEDLACGKNNLIYLDFLLSFHHSLRDFEYFISKGFKLKADYSKLPLWLSLVDLTFFLHFNAANKKIASLIPKRSAFLQNFFALNLIIDQCLKDKIKSTQARKLIYKHLLFSVYNLVDKALLIKLFDLIELHDDWSDLVKKKQPNLNVKFLETLCNGLNVWLGNTILRFPDLISQIEHAAVQTDKSFRSQERV